MLQIHNHHFSGVLDLIPFVLQKFIKRRVQKRTDLENRGGMIVGIHGFTVGNFFFNGNERSAHLLYAVGAVGIIVGKTDQPPVIQLDFVGWPRVQEISSIRFI